MKKLAILHTTPATIPSLGALAKQELPGVQVHNLLDDGILPAINAAGEITHEVRARFYALAQCAALARPDAVLCACSSVGGLLEECRAFLPMPLARIDEPMARTAVQAGAHIAVVATLRSTLEPTARLLRRVADEAHTDIILNPTLVEGAGALLAAGKTGEYEDLIAGHLAGLVETSQVVVLAQASMAGAAARLGKTAAPILSSPLSGMQALKPLLGL